MSRQKLKELTLVLADVDATEHLGAVLAGTLADGMVIFLHGDLGTGKTTLVRGVLRQLGFEGAVKSPTYTLLEEYAVGAREIIHFDLYRLDDPEELDLIGIRDYFNGRACCFIEWPQRGEGYLPRHDLEITITHQGAGRVASISALSESGAQTLQAIQTEFYPESR